MDHHQLIVIIYYYNNLLVGKIFALLFGGHVYKIKTGG